MESKEKKQEGKKSAGRRALDIIEWTLIGLLGCFDILLLVLRTQMPSDDSGINWFGNEVRIVLTGSMEGSDSFYQEHPEYEIRSLPQGSAAFVNTVPQDEAKQQEWYASLQEGDVLTFYYPLGSRYVPVTHRIIEIDESMSGDSVSYSFVCRGDNPEGDQTVSPFSPTQTVRSDTGMVIGKVTGDSPGFGFFLTHFVQNKIVLVFLVIVPAFGMMVYEIVKVIVIINKDKKAEAEAATNAQLEDQSSQIEELKKQIEELQKKSGNKEE